MTVGELIAQLHKMDKNWIVATRQQHVTTNGLIYNQISECEDVSPVDLKERNFTEDVDWDLQNQTVVILS